MPTGATNLLCSTYRLQFHAGFTFRDAAAIVPYLSDLGITHVYASPYLKAIPGSTHGYDIIDHCELNPELGTETDFHAFVDALAAHGMSHILDMVPNHVGVATNDNVWWNDVLTRGAGSRYAHFFDILWHIPTRPELQGKLLLPALGKPYAEVLEKGELQLKRDENGGAFAIWYYDRRFPLSPQSQAKIADRGIESFAGTPGAVASFDALDALLNEQHYRLAWWRVAPDEINYRRFFDINGLAALAMEHEDVFDATHALVLRLVREGKLAGLRIDHPDGLLDPKQYFHRLQSSAHPPIASRASQIASPDLPIYVVVEKILGSAETLLRDWPVHGTTGYDFLTRLNSLFIDRSAETDFSRLYEQLTHRQESFEDIVYRSKRLIIRTSFARELQVLTYYLDRIAQADRHTRDFTYNALRRALREMIACFPLYRSYVSPDGVSPDDVESIDRTVATASGRNRDIDAAIFRFIRDVILQRHAPSSSDEDGAARLRFAQRFQQFTAPVTAKGIEDTAFYIFNRFVSLNEVGGDPSRFGLAPEALHEYFADRQRNWPYALSPLSTHDTKRSEDVRARLNVLSEIPGEWAAAVGGWMRRPRRHAAPGRTPAIDPNDEYLLYQTLVGAYPPDAGGERVPDEFIARIQAYMKKALRESKVHSSWHRPNEAYEAAVAGFISAILDDRGFLAELHAFATRVARLGVINSLAQTLIRLTAPGVPDTYQGTELIDLSLVDPDNRRDVGYARRRRLLSEVRDYKPGRRDGQARDASPDHLKLFVIWKCLTYRRAHAQLFTTGDYLPAEATGPRSAHVFAFARRRLDDGQQYALVAVPRCAARLPPPGTWSDTRIPLAGTAPPRIGLLRNLFTDETLTPAADGSLAASELFARFPVAMLIAPA